MNHAATPVTDLTPPPGCTVEQPGHRLRIVLHPRSPRRVRAVTLGILAAGASIVAAVFLAHRAGWIGTPAAGVITAGLIAPLFGAALLFWTDRIVLEIGDGVIRARRRRYLLPRARSLATGDVAQLFCVRARGTAGNATFYRFHLIALLAGGRKVVLIPDLKHREHALFLERFAEKHLGIVPRPVRGEMRQVAARFRHTPGHKRRSARSWQFGPIMQQFVSHSPLSRRGKFVRDIRFMLSGREFRVRPRRK